MKWQIVIRSFYQYFDSGNSGNTSIWIYGFQLEPVYLYADIGARIAFYNKQRTLKFDLSGMDQKIKPERCEVAQQGVRIHDRVVKLLLFCWRLQPSHIKR